MMRFLMTTKLIIVFVLSSIAIQCQDSGSDPIPPPPSQKVNVGFYLTKANASVKFAKQTTSIFKGLEAGNATITLNPATTYQEMDGFGYTLTGGSALHLSKMTELKRKQLLTELFDTSANNIGISYLRISIGASDLDEVVFSYNDLPAGQTDMNLEYFSMDQDRKYLIPMLKEIKAINPEIKLLGSPWSAPSWMKDNGASKGGSLKPEYYDVYAQYFVKYIREMEADGLTINAITIQNEPLHPGNNPSMYMVAEDQAAFIKQSLGPAFEAAGLTTKIIIYDHNADRTDYPLTVLDDPDAKKYVDGSAFHLYGGSINDLTAVHNAHPDKNLYFTEQWVGAGSDFGENLNWHMQNIIIGSARNWCKAIFEWNLAANSDLEPHTPGGCTQCLGALTIDGDVVSRNVAYYIMAHISKHVRPGSVRIQSNTVSGMSNVAFLTPDQKIVLIVFNSSSEEKNFNFKLADQEYNTMLDGGAVGTFILNL